MSSINPSDEAAAILVRLLNALARPQGKRLSAASQADVGQLCELLMYGGEELDTALEDVPRRSPAEHAITDESFQRWRAARAVERE